MRRSLIAVATAILTLVVAASPAAAEHGNKANAGPPDNAAQAVRNRSLTNLGEWASNHGRGQLDRTDINTSVGDGDLYVYDASYTQDWFGLTTCTSRNWLNGRCDRMDIKFNYRRMGPLTLGHWQSLGCHEFGHSGGLGHRYSNNDTDNNSCMRDGIWPKYLDSHDINSVNAIV